MRKVGLNERGYLEGWIGGKLGSPRICSEVSMFRSGKDPGFTYRQDNVWQFLAFPFRFRCELDVTCVATQGVVDMCFNQWNRKRGLNY
jgi:hypothetical protein